MKENLPLVSIIIPVYNTEKYLVKCLNSVIAQTYKNLQIICVNDASPDASSKIIGDYIAKDKRIIEIINPENKGLFQTRLAGADISTGDYICFLDSDDTISIDWIRLLVKKAIAENADMTFGKTIQVDKNGFFYNNNCASRPFNKNTIIGEEVLATLLRNEGLDFSLHTIWNKLYSRQLWEKCRQDFGELLGHLIMAEDIAFSVVLYYYSNSLAFSDHIGYFYNRHDEASTSVAISLDRIKKNILDVSRVFRYVEEFLKKKNTYERYSNEFNNFKDRNFRIYSNILKARGLENNKEFVNLLCEGFSKKNIELARTEDFYFYEIRTPWEGDSQKYIMAKEAIAREDYDIISFDLFDTLLVRPFFNVADFYKYFEGKYYNKLKEFSINAFTEKRAEAERICREKLRFETNFEDCKLIEIYDTFGKLYNVNSDIVESLKNMEEETELNLCEKRNSGIELYELAIHLGKKVIIVSDTFYDEIFIKKLLAKNDISAYEEVFISCEERCLKATKNLFESVKRKYSQSVNKIIHFGDNWNSDVLCAKESGIEGRFFPKTTEIFSSVHHDNYVGDSLIINTKDVPTFADINNIMQQLPISACLGIIANHMFDKPFPAWNRELRYNADFYFMGYYPIGMEMLGIASWIAKVSNRERYKKIIFLARDGYLPKLAFDNLKRARSIKTESEYFYVSRRAILPIMILKRKNFSIIQDYVEIYNHTPHSIIQMFGKYLFEKEKLERELCEIGLGSDLKFSSQASFAKFINQINQHLDIDSLKMDFDPVIKQIKDIFIDGSATFDLGYSGRVQSALTEIVGRPIDCFFVHSTGYKAESIAGKDGFKIHSYISYTPRITSIIREYFFSELCPSCISYIVDNGKLNFVFDETKYGNEEKFISEEISRGVNSFASDYCNKFGKDNFMFEFRGDEISLPFEMFINEIPEKDMFCFRLCSTEDNLFGNYSKSFLVDAWKYRLKNNAIKKSENLVVKYVNWADRIINTEQYKKMSRVKKALLLFLFDNRLFREKIKNLKKK